MKQGHIFFISWFAWAGKWTVIQWLLQSNIPNFELVISCKTREPRESEVLGVDYYKLSWEEFQSAIARGEFLEYNLVHGQNYYGTRYVDVIDNGILKWKKILKEMDITILPKLLDEKPELRKDFTYIFLDIPKGLIKERMLQRWDDVTGLDFVKRMESVEKEKELMYLADYIIDATKSKQEVLEAVKEIILNK